MLKLLKIRKEIDIESLTKMPHVNVDLILDSTEQKKAIVEQLIQNLNSDTDEFCTEYNEKNKYIYIKRIKKKNYEDLTKFGEIEYEMDYVEIKQTKNLFKSLIKDEFSIRMLHIR